MPTPLTQALYSELHDAHGIFGRETQRLVVIPGVTVQDYELVERLSVTFMGEVWKARRRSQQESVVLKFLPLELRCNRAELSRFRQSFELVRRLCHPAICPVTELSEDDRLGLFLVMPFVDGITLSEHRWKLVENQTTLPLAELVRCLKPIAEALDFAHGQGVIHRDIKPANILIPQDGALPQLLDFGLASEIHSTLVRTSQMHVEACGTLPYMAPEVWRGRPAERRSDQYSLAIVCYELLAGHPPFDLPDAVALRECVLREPVAGLTGAYAAANAVLAKGLAKNPEERFETCSDFIAALETVGRGIQWMPHTARRNRPAHGRSWRGIAAVACMSLTALAWSQRKPSEPPRTKSEHLQTPVAVEASPKSEPPVVAAKKPATSSSPEEPSIKPIEKTADVVIVAPAPAPKAEPPDPQVAARAREQAAQRQASQVAQAASRSEEAARSALASEAAPEAWKTAQQQHAEARTAFENREYAAAEQRFGQAVKSYEEARQKAQQVHRRDTARREFDQEVARLGKETLDQHGGAEWDAVQQQVASAASLEPEPATERIRTATNELKSLERQVRIRQARQLILVGDEAQALKVLRTISPAKPNDSEVSSLIQQCVVAKPDSWLKRAESEAKGHIEGGPGANLWSTLAMAFHDLDDEEGYNRAMRQAVESAKGITTANAVSSFRDLAKTQLRTGDIPGARASIVEGSRMCDTESNLYFQARNHAALAGLASRAKDTALWDAEFSKAKAAAQKSTQGDAAILAALAKTTAYAYAHGLKESQEAAQEVCQLNASYRDYFRSEAQAWAYQVAVEKRDPAAAQQCFRAAVLRQAALYTRNSDADESRRLMAYADINRGVFDRAWVAASNVASPHSRGSLMASLAIGLAEAGEPVAGQRLLELERSENTSTAWSRVIAQRVLLPSSDLAKLVTEIEGLPSPSERICAWAGFATGLKWKQKGQSLKTGNRTTRVMAQFIEHGLQSATSQRRKSDQIRHSEEGLFSFSTFASERGLENGEPLPFENDANAADANRAAGWLARARQELARTQNVELAAYCWLAVAEAASKLGDREGSHDALLQSRLAILSMWDQILAQRPISTPDYQGKFQLNSDYRTNRQETAGIGQIVAVLLEMADVQQRIGQADDARESLHLAVVSLDPVAVNSGFANRYAAIGTKPWWLAQLAGAAFTQGDIAGSGVYLQTAKTSLGSDARGNAYLDCVATVRSGDLSLSQKLVEAYPRQQDVSYNAAVHAELALLAARKGQRDLYRTNSGVAQNDLQSRYRNPDMANYALLAEADALFGQEKAAYQKLSQFGRSSRAQDRVQAALVKYHIQQGSLEAARVAMAGLSNSPSELEAVRLYAQHVSGSASDQPSLKQWFATLKTPEARAAAYAGFAMPIAK